MLSNRDLESRIRTAFDHATPDQTDDLKALLSQCGRGVKDMKQNLNIANPSTRKKRTPLWTGLAVAAAFVLILGLGAGLHLSKTMAVDSQILLDVNPSIELEVNAKNRVIDAEAKNEDAEAVLDGMDLKNTDLDVAVNALLGSLVKHGYIGEKANSVLVTVENDDEERGRELQAALTAKISKALSSSNIDGAILSQNLNDVQKEAVEELADRLDISDGKAALVRKLAEANSTYDEAILARLPINDLNLLLSHQNTTLANSGLTLSGSASDKAYIGKEKARDIALQRAGVKADETTFLEIEMDLDDGRVEYELDFYTADAAYEVSVDAKTGEILDFEIEELDEDDMEQDEIVDKATLDKVTAAAFKHAGVKAENVTFLHAEKDTEDGVPVCELKFLSGTKKYEYEVRLSDFAVIDAEIEETQHVSSGSGSKGITAEKAKAIAQQRAPKATVTSCEQDTEDGVPVFEIELKEGNTEYDCTVRISDGAILEWEYEIDD